jgi:hypothetical protein
MELLHDLVHVRIGGRTGLLSRLYEANDNQLVLGAPYANDVQIAPEIGTPIEIGWMTKTGVRWHSAVVTLRETRDDGIAFGARLMDQPVRVDRRRHPRAKLVAPITLALGLGAATAAGELLDVGAGGLRVRVDADLTVGDVLQIAIETLDEPIRLSARVYRRAGDHYVFTYELFAAGSRERLVDLAFRRAAAA